MTKKRVDWKDQLSEPILKIIRENPGLIYSQINEKLDPPMPINALRKNQMKYLLETEQIENREKKGKPPRWYIKKVEEFVK